MIKAGRRKQFRLEHGQGLVEYALILVLVAVVTIVIVGLLGEQIQVIFCDIVLSLGDSAPEIEACEAPRVVCSGASNGQVFNGGVPLEGIVTDNNGPESIQRVEFYVDGNLRQTEYIYHYCLAGTDDPCPPRSLSSGTHTLEIKAYDTDGYEGTCSVTVTVN